MASMIWDWPAKNRRVTSPLHELHWNEAKPQARPVQSEINFKNSRTNKRIGTSFRGCNCSYCAVGNQKRQKKLQPVQAHVNTLNSNVSVPLEKYNGRKLWRETFGDEKLNLEVDNRKEGQSGWSTVVSLFLSVTTYMYTVGPATPLVTKEKASASQCNPQIFNFPNFEAIGQGQACTPMASPF